MGDGGSAVAHARFIPAKADSGFAIRVAGRGRANLPAGCPVEFRNYGIEEFRDYGIPESLNSSILQSTWCPPSTPKPESGTLVSRPGTGKEEP
jgi:hypothetical protein